MAPFLAKGIFRRNWHRSKLPFFGVILGLVSLLFHASLRINELSWHMIRAWVNIPHPIFERNPLNPDPGCEFRLLMMLEPESVIVVLNCWEKFSFIFGEIPTSSWGVSHLFGGFISVTSVARRSPRSETCNYRGVKCLIIALLLFGRFSRQGREK